MGVRLRKDKEARSKNRDENRYYRTRKHGWSDSRRNRYKGIVEKENVIGFDLSDALKDKAKNNYGINIAGGNEDVLANSDVVILAVKPQHMGDMLAKIKDKWNKNTLII